MNIYWVRVRINPNPVYIHILYTYIGVSKFHKGHKGFHRVNPNPVYIHMVRVNPNSIQYMYLAEETNHDTARKRIWTALMHG